MNVSRSRPVAGSRRTGVESRLDASHSSLPDSANPECGTLNVFDQTVSTSADFKETDDATNATVCYSINITVKGTIKL